MKKHLLYLCTIGISLFLTSCIAGIERDISISSGEDAEITVEQARKFFEQELLTRNDDTPSPNILSPGDFTPQWDNAQISQNYRIACVDVPIIPRFGYRAIRSEYKLGKATAYSVRVSQKLIVVKDRESGDMAQYIMSIIPDKEFAAKHKGDISNLFLNANDRGKFSGILLYTCHGIPVRLSKYIDGKRVEGISTCGVAGKQKYKELLLKIYKGLSDIKVLRYAGITSRSGEDPGWDFDAGEIEDVIIIGSGPSDNNNDDNEKGNDSPLNQQPDPEDPNKAPFENPDDEEDTGNEGNENNNKDENNDNKNNDNINEHLDKLQKILSNAKLNQYISRNRLPFTKNNKQKTFRTRIQRDKQTGKIKAILGFEYNEEYLSSLSENGLLLVLLHEYIHAYRAINGFDFSHDAMINDPMYLEGIKNIFPGGSDFFYDAMRYAGCPDADGFNNLSDERQNIILDIIDRKIYK